MCWWLCLCIDICGDLLARVYSSDRLVDGGVRCRMLCIALLVAEVKTFIRTVNRMSFRLCHRFACVVFCVNIKVAKSYSFGIASVVLLPFVVEKRRSLLLAPPFHLSISGIFFSRVTRC